MVRGIVLTLLGVTATLWATEPERIRPLRLSGPHHTRSVAVVPGPRLDPNRVGHMGAPHPVHAALQFAGQTWIGTHSAGLLRFGPRWSAPRRVSVQQGLPSAQINDLLRDGTALLVATGGGMARVDVGGQHHARPADPRRAALRRGADPRGRALQLRVSHDGGSALHGRGVAARGQTRRHRPGSGQPAGAGRLSHLAPAAVARRSFGPRHRALAADQRRGRDPRRLQPEPRHDAPRR